MPPAITILTDFGCKDHYVGVMKGVILTINPLATIVDLSHAVAPQNVLHGAILLRQAYSYFPRGTIHIAVVDPGVGTGRKPIVASADGFYFVGPDNGIFGLIYQHSKSYTVHELTNNQFFLPAVSSTFHGRDIFAPAAAHLSLGVSPEEMGLTYKDFQRISLPSPIVDNEILRGTIIYVDSFGNLVTNISARHLADLREFECLRVRTGAVAFPRICRNYEEVEKGQPLALFGSFGLLEISVREGDASSSLGLREGDEVIVF